ncbi:MAG: prolipoprotein diacylglyceryl transferase [Polyangiaceae bacterium]|nr:prolipoprotein diacylglyceryl transferase [Polyangiaceae bacterium]
MPKFTWSPDPEALGFVLPTQFLTVMIAVAVVAGIFAVLSYRAGDRGGATFTAVIAVACLVVGFYWPTWQPWVAIRYYSLLFVVVFLGGYWLLDWQVRRGGGERDDAGDFIVYGVIGVLAGARLGHVAFYDLDKALADPWWVFAIWTGGLSSHGATIGLILAMWLFTARRRIPFLEGSDRFAFSAALGAILVRFGNFLNSEIVGAKIEDGSWGVLFVKTCEQRPEAAGCWKLFGARSADFADKCMTGNVDCWGYDESVIYRHPSQLYEAGLGTLVLITLFVFDRVWGKEKRPRGALISLFFALYFVGRFIVEFFKDYQTPFEREAESLTMGQWLSIPGVLLGIYGLYWAFKNRLPAGWAPAGTVNTDEFGELDEEDDEAGKRDSFHDDDVDAEFGGQRRRRRKGKGKKRKGRRAAAGSATDRSSVEPDEAGEEGAGAPREDDVARETADDNATGAGADDAPPPEATTRRGKRRKRSARPAAEKSNSDEDDD